MITPANFLTNNHLVELRRLLLNESSIDHIVVIDGGVFRGISVDNAIFAVQRGSPSRRIRVAHARPTKEGFQQTSEASISASRVANDQYLLFTGTTAGTAQRMWERVTTRSVALGAVAHVNFGKQLRDRTEYPGDVIQVRDRRSVKRPYSPCYTGRDIHRYHLAWGSLACLDDEIARRGGCWDAERQNAKNKLLTRQVGRYPEFAFDSEGYQRLNTAFMIIARGDVSPLFLLGVLNSKLLRMLWLGRFYDQRRTFPKIKGTYLKELPIPAVSISDRPARARCDRLVALVDGMLALHKHLATSRSEHDSTVLQRQIEATDRQIDQSVYELYGLTEEEIKIVESS